MSSTAGLSGSTTGTTKLILRVSINIPRVSINNNIYMISNYQYSIMYIYNPPYISAIGRGYGRMGVDREESGQGFHGGRIRGGYMRSGSGKSGEGPC